jgi:hypothetical protein
MEYNLRRVSLHSLDEEVLARTGIQLEVGKIRLLRVLRGFWNLLYSIGGYLDGDLLVVVASKEVVCEFFSWILNLGLFDKGLHFHVDDFECRGNLYHRVACGLEVAADPGDSIFLYEKVLV